MEPVGTEGPALDEDSGSTDEEDDCAPEDDGFADEDEAFEISDFIDEDESPSSAIEDSELDEEDSSLTIGSLIVGLESPQPAKVNGKAALKVNKRAILGIFTVFLLFKNIIYKKEQNLYTIHASSLNLNWWYKNRNYDV